MMANGAAKLACARPLYAVHLEDGGRVDARALIIASGAQYRRPAIANLSKFEGAGVYYAAFRMESQLCVGEEVVIVDGGNSAGQAAVFLADAAMLVQLLVRKDGLADTMSRYLIRRIDDHPAITLHTQAELVALDGDRHLARVQWGDTGTGVVETRDIRHVFMMTGAVPNTKWLEGCVALDQRGFIKTGPGLSPEDLTTALWPLARSPHLLETNRPGVFALGDVRGGNIKRVASAVGEGSIAVAFVHQVLRQ
jgi:thioredoxin reductase (NADPH)